MGRRGRLAAGSQQLEIGIAVVAGDAVAGDVDMGEGRRRSESGHRMAQVAVLSGRQVIRPLDQLRARGKKAADMTTFATAGNAGVHRAEKYGRGESACRFVDMAITAALHCRYMIGFLADRADRDIGRIAVVAGFAIVIDTQMREVERWRERCRNAVTDAAILAGR